MTVKELIAKLSAYPPDAVVIYSYCSEYDEMEAEEVALVRAKDRRIARHHGRYLDCTYTWKPVEAGAEFVTVVVFPGN